MKLRCFIVLLFGLLIFTTSAAAQVDSRDTTREKLRALLAANGPKVNIEFRQSDKNQWTFLGVLNTGLANADSFEVVIGVTADATIGFRIYPHYRGAYINLNRASNVQGLARQLLRLSDTNFLFWGIDETSDVFAGYTFTLESGFPEQAIRTVLWSIKPLDQYVGAMKVNVDGPQGH